MSALSSDRKPPVDYGVQIRFIKDLHDTGGGFPEKTRGRNKATPPSNKYGVAVRVQGISGQPYVVLKDGEKGDSYGVQLKTDSPQPQPQTQPQTSNSGPASPYSSLPRGKEPADMPNPYSPVGQPASSPVSSVSLSEEDGVESFGSPFRRPPGDGQAGSQGEGEGGTRREGQADRMKKDPGSKPANGVEKDISLANEIREEFNEAGLKPVGLKGVGSRAPNQNGVGLTGSLGRQSGKNRNPNLPSDTFPEPPPPVKFEGQEEEPVAAIDTNSLAPINKLISKFNSSTPGAQTRGRSGARQRLRFDERRRSRSLDARKDVPPVVSTPSPPSPTPNPYAAASSPSAPPQNGLGSSPVSVAKVTALAASKPSINRTPGQFVGKDAHPAIPPKKPGMPPPLRNRGQSLEVVSREEALTTQAIHTPLKEGPSESELSTKQKVNLVDDTTNHAKTPRVDRNLKKELEDSLHENAQLQKRLDVNKTELLQAQEELAQLRMAREVAECRVRLHEDQLAGLQEDLRRVSENSPHTLSLQTDVNAFKAELAEAAMARQRQEEVLHQRERELTALKGALKDEVASHDKEMEALRELYSQDVETLRSTMEQVSQSQLQIEEERQKVNESIYSLEEELESSRDQGGVWRTQLETTTEELQSTKQELLRARLEKDEFEVELKKLQDTLTSTKKKVPLLDETDSQDPQRRHDDLKQARSELDKQRAETRKKEEELKALRTAGEKKEAELKAEIDSLKDQSQRDRQELQRTLEKAKELDQESTKETNQELQETNTRLRERLARMRLHSSVPLSSEADQALEDENRSLRTQLEEAKRGASRLGKEKEELGRRLEERDLERESLKRSKSDLEEQKRLLDRALEKINKEMEMMMGDSRQSVQALQSQLDEYRERSRRDLLDVQRSSKDRLAELQRAQVAHKSLQEEVSRLKKDLLVCGEERDSAQLERDLLSSRLKHLESELDTERSSHTDRGREIRAIEDKVKSLEIELDEEKSSVELLNDRITRSREQVDQLRADLLQERSSKHDLEMDKSSLERQVKELKTRVADMEGQSRPAPGISLLEGKVQELEERLRSEEREKTSIQASQRRVERKLKDLNITLDQERNQHAEQRDQLALRVKALKRQVDESESEVERLEGVRRKVLRELEEQQEVQDTQQAKITALEGELKRKVQQARRSVLGSSNLSSEDEDGLYDANSITSILTEGQLQTTNC